MAASVLINKSLNSRADNLTLRQAVETYDATKSEDFRFLLGHKLKLALANLKDRRKFAFAAMAKQPKKFQKGADGKFSETEQTQDLLNWINTITRTLAPN